MKRFIELETLSPLLPSRAQTRRFAGLALNMFRRRSLFLAVGCLCALTCFADVQTQENKAQIAEQTDSIDYRALDEVVVFGSSSVARKDGIAITPSKRVKSNAGDGISLLEILRPPLLRFDPESKEIKSNFGESISYFIDGTEASLQEVRNIRPGSVVRVDVLRDPVDPEFHGAKNVVNFVLKKVEYGGYVSASANQYFALNKGNYSLYSKLINKDNTFQVLGNWGYYNSSGDINNSLATYLFQDKSGNQYTETRENNSYATKIHQQDYSAAFQWIKKHGNNSFITNVGVSGINNPSISSSGRIKEILSDSDPESVAESKSNKRIRSVTPYVSFSTNLSLPHRSSLYAKLVMAISFNKQSNTYRGGTPYVDLLNTTSEKAYAPRFTVVYSKRLRSADLFQANVIAQPTFYRTNYGGSVSSFQKLLSGSYKLNLRYNLSLSNSWSLGLSVPLTLYSIKVNDDKARNNLYPGVNLSLNGNVGTKNNFNIFGYVITPQSPDFTYADINRQTTDILGEQGNPELKNSTRYSGGFSYTWLPSDKVNANFTAQYEHVDRLLVCKYLPADGMMYVQYVNGGVSDNLRLDLSVNFSLWDNKFSFTPNLAANYYHQSGIYNQAFWAPFAGLFMNYMPTMNWRLSLGYMPLEIKNLSWDLGAIHRTTAGSFDFTIAYNNEALSASLNVNPFFPHKKSTSRITSDVYSSYSYYNTWFDRQYVKLSLRYNLDFGKKVGHWQDLQLESSESTSVR